MNKRIRRKYIKTLAKAYSWRLITACPKKKVIINAFIDWYTRHYKKAPLEKYANNVWYNYEAIRNAIIYKPKILNKISYSYLIFMGVLASNLGLTISNGTLESLYEAGVHRI